MRTEIMHVRKTYDVVAYRGYDISYVVGEDLKREFAELVLEEAIQLDGRNNLQGYDDLRIFVIRERYTLMHK